MPGSDACLGSIRPCPYIGRITLYNCTSLVAQTVKNLLAMQETRVQSWVGKIPWEREWQPTLVVLPGEFPWTEEPGGLCTWAYKESDTTKTFIYVLIRTKVQLGLWNNKGGGDMRKSWEERWDDTSSQM